MLFAQTDILQAFIMLGISLLLIAGGCGWAAFDYYKEKRRNGPR